MNSHLHILRPKQWLKNIIAVIPALLSLSLVENLGNLAIIFFILCLASSLGYIYNDINNIEEDRRNGKNRPLATGKLKLKEAFIIQFICATLLGVSIVLLDNILVSAVILGFLFTDIVYTKILRRIKVIDVLTISTKYPMRYLAGVFIIGGIISLQWIALIFSLAFILAIMKRKGELFSNMKKSKLFNEYKLKELNVLFVITFVFYMIIWSSIAFSPNFLDNILFMAVTLNAIAIVNFYAKIRTYGQAKSLAILNDRFFSLSAILVIIVFIIQLYW